MRLTKQLKFIGVIDYVGGYFEGSRMRKVSDFADTASKGQHLRSVPHFMLYREFRRRPAV